MPKQIYYKPYWSAPGDGHLAAAWCASVLHSWKNRISHEKLNVAKPEKKKKKKQRKNSPTRVWLMKTSSLCVILGSTPNGDPSSPLLRLPSRKVHLITRVKRWSGHPSQLMEEWSEEDADYALLTWKQTRVPDDIPESGINVRRSWVGSYRHPTAACYPLKVEGSSMAWHLPQLTAPTFSM